MYYTPVPTSPSGRLSVCAVASLRVIFARALKKIRNWCHHVNAFMAICPSSLNRSNGNNQPATISYKKRKAVTSTYVDATCAHYEAELGRIRRIASVARATLTTRTLAKKTFVPMTSCFVPLALINCQAVKSRAQTMNEAPSYGARPPGDSAIRR